MEQSHSTCTPQNKTSVQRDESRVIPSEDKTAVLLETIKVNQIELSAKSEGIEREEIKSSR